ALFGDSGTEVRIAPLLDGVRMLSGEKIQWYLAAELRDRIRQTGARINVSTDLRASSMPSNPANTKAGCCISCRPHAPRSAMSTWNSISTNPRMPIALRFTGTVRAWSRIITGLDDFAHPPWSLRYLQCHIDAPFVNITPGPRTGLIRDAAYMALCEDLGPLEGKLNALIEEQRRAEEEQASREQLRTIQRAFREALLG